MKIAEVLKADHNVSSIYVAVRKRDTEEHIMSYSIGRYVRPGISERFICETELGGLYGCGTLKTLYMGRTIQHSQLRGLPESADKNASWVMEEEIPGEIMALTIRHMHPYGAGRSDGLHGYRFDCYVDDWDGIDGENVVLETVTK